MPDAVVIGAGVVGAATAHALAQADLEVEVLEAGRVAGGASAATFAMDITPLKTPRALFDLSVQSGHEHLALQELCPGATWIHPTCILEWERTSEARARLREQVRRLQGWGYPAGWVSPAEAVEVEPVLAQAGLEDRGPEIALYRAGAWYEPRAFAEALLDRAARRGARVHTHDPVVGLTQVRGRVVEVATATGRRISSELVVNCAGPEADRVAALAGARLPLHRVPGVVVVTTPSAIPLSAIVSADGLHLRPQPGGRVLLHSWPSDAHLRPRPPWHDAAAIAARVHAQALRLLPALADCTVQTAAVGVRPIPPDGLPIAGFLEGVDNLYTLVAHSAVHLAPIIGRLAAEELVGVAHGRLDAFRPGRERVEQGDVADASTRTMLAQMSDRASSAGPA